MEARQPGGHMWDICVGSQPGGPGEGQREAPTQQTWKRAAGHEEMPAQRLLAIAIQVVIGRTSLDKAGTMEPLIPALLWPSSGPQDNLWGPDKAPCLPGGSLTLLSTRTGSGEIKDRK